MNIGRVKREKNIPPILLVFDIPFDKTPILTYMHILCQTNIKSKDSLMPFSRKTVE